MLASSVAFFLVALEATHIGWIGIPVATAFVMTPASHHLGSMMDAHDRVKHPHQMGASFSEAGTVGEDTLAAVDGAMMTTYDSLATRLIERYEKDLASKSLRNDQLFVCVAGGPGSGKSTLSAAVAQRINEQLCWKLETTNDDDAGNDDGDTTKTNGEEESPAPHAIVLPMDGFHYPRSELRTMGDNPAIPATYDDLLARRGAPWTFDAERCLQAFAYARLNGEARLPTYSRAHSDPVPNGVTLHPLTKIVLLEGNYLLAWEAQRWEAFRAKDVFDETWYLACRSREEQRARLVTRHLETWSEEKTKMWGKGTTGAEAKADANDMKNADWIDENSRKHADLVIESV